VRGEVSKFKSPSLTASLLVTIRTREKSLPVDLTVVINHWSLEKEEERNFKRTKREVEELTHHGSVT
jgi:hypothetical protein